MEANRPVVIFDGVCEMCNSSVNFIMRHEKRPILLFTANQNAPGRELLTKYGEDPKAVSSIYFVENGQLYSHSKAVLRISRYLKFPFNLAYGFIVVPRFLRDVIYKWIARNRYRWFGKKDTCRIPTPEEQARFLID